MHTTITAQLEQHYQRCNSPRRRTQIMTRWADTPALNGHTPADIIDICSRATLDQNPIVAALIDRLQHDDNDAATVVMTALKPMVISVAHSRTKGRLTDDLLDSYWAAVGHMLASIDPTVDPVDRDGQPLVFITHLGNEIGSSRRRLDPAVRRWLARRSRGWVEIPTLLDREPISVELEARGIATPEHAVEDDAIARLELHRITHAIASGQIPPSRWAQLVAHRIHHHPDAGTPARVRVAVHRTATQLSQLIDHAA